MESQRIIKFIRFTLQGIAIASLGTIGVTPSIGGFILGLFSFLISFALLAYEKGDD